MAWMRLMGADSVAYHRATVLGRADDHPGAALAYYDSRGETPLRWGGSGAVDLGLEGTVSAEAYEAIYGPGGARHPVSGDRLVRTLRPGMELVISAHKTVAELGVIGRVADMHAILDAERDATLGYLDALTRAMGGRRGRSRVASPTGGLVYAHTRHATSRAGDPCPHDHVLLANVVEMADQAGGYKAPDMVTWRQHLHAATLVGRLAGARRAVELGYGIEADPGRSGRLRHWRIVGIPEEVRELHSKRAAEIEAAVGAHGVDSYRARSVAARTTRKAKHHTPVAELVGHWRAELAEAGHHPAQLLEAVAAAGAAYRVPGPLSEPELRWITEAALAPDGPVRTKVFRQADVIVALAPVLFGRPVDQLPRLVDAVLSSPAAVPLLRVRGARERHWATTHTLVTEEAIARCVARGMVTPSAVTVPVEAVAAAIGRMEHRLGASLTHGQRRAVEGICRSGRRADLVVGIAGSGKTTALACVREAFEAAGFQVVGTATSGQAARTLAAEAGIRSRTVASLLWRLEHGRLSLTSRHVVVLDESGMTEDTALLALLTAAEVAEARVVLVGDDRQLGSVGPGGAMGALVARHRGAVHVLSDNVRQVDARERQALAELRAGDVGAAVSWYAGHGRVRAGPMRDQLLAEMVDAWADDALDGKDVAMLAWRRANVAELNRQARQRWQAAGRLYGPEVCASGGRCYAAGDRVVTLAPGGGGRLVTSERGEVVTVDPEALALVARMGEGRLVLLSDEELGADRLDHAYATTVHRAQGMTVDVAHRLCDGGGRELAYVAMSRARLRSTAWVVADSAEQAQEDLVRDWSMEHRPRWAIDTGVPDVAGRYAQPAGVVPDRLDRRLAGARVATERRALDGLAPPDPSRDLARVQQALADLRETERDLDTGQGRWRHTEVGTAARERIRIAAALRQAQEFSRGGSFGNRRYWRAKARSLAEHEQVAEQHFADLARPVRARLAVQRSDLEAAHDHLVSRQDDRRQWLDRHPAATHRLLALESEDAALDMHVRLDRLRRSAEVHAVPEIPLPGH